MQPDIQVLFDGASGIYIPQRFAREIERERVFGVSDEDFAILDNPEHDLYWDAWSDVLDHATLVEGDDPEILKIARDAALESRDRDVASILRQSDHLILYSIYQDSDVFMVPEGMVWNDEHDRYTYEQPDRDAVIARIESECAAVVLCEPESERIEGNASAIDEATDAEIARHIRHELERGNEWAWCSVEVRVSWRGLSASNYLGCCSYANEREFRDDGYFADMRREAIASLADDVLADPEMWGMFYTKERNQ